MPLWSSSFVECTLFPNVTCHTSFWLFLVLFRHRSHICHKNVSLVSDEPAGAANTWETVLTTLGPALTLAQLMHGCLPAVPDQGLSGLHKGWHKTQLSSPCATRVAIRQAGRVKRRNMQDEMSRRPSTQTDLARFSLTNTQLFLSRRYLWSKALIDELFMLRIPWTLPDFVHKSQSVQFQMETQRFGRRAWTWWWVLRTHFHFICQDMSKKALRGAHEADCCSSKEQPSAKTCRAGVWDHRDDWLATDKVFSTRCSHQTNDDLTRTSSSDAA